MHLLLQLTNLMQSQRLEMLYWPVKTLWRLISLEIVDGVRSNFLAICVKVKSILSIRSITARSDKDKCLLIIIISFRLSRPDITVTQKERFLNKKVAFSPKNIKVRLSPFHLDISQPECCEIINAADAAKLLFCKIKS